MPPIFIPPEGVPPEITVPEGKALVILYVPGTGYKAVLIPKPGPPGNLPPTIQPVDQAPATP
jgi:hypothetical protein